MRKLILLLLLLPLVALSQEPGARLISGRVVDAKTGEAMPYVSIYLANGRGTLTNSDGYFHASVLPTDVLTFSFIGYEKQRIVAGKLPSIVCMTPMETLMREVVVRPAEVMDILQRVINHMKADYKKNKAAQKGYFVRHLLKYSYENVLSQYVNDSYLIEAFLEAKAAINLREETILSGTSGRNAEGAESDVPLRSTNLQRLTEVGARTYESTYWEATIKPLAGMSTIKKYYQTTIQTLCGEDGQMLYRIDFTPKSQRKLILSGKRYITGTLFVDASDCRPLSFDGKVNNAFQRVDFERRPAKIGFHLVYDYTDGYAAVSHLSVVGGNAMMQYRILLFNLPEDYLPRSKQVKASRNILSDIDAAGYEAELWDRYDIIKRTAEEEAALKQKRDE
jgi:hypothetical protein